MQNITRFGYLQNFCIHNNQSIRHDLMRINATFQVFIQKKYTMQKKSHLIHTKILVRYIINIPVVIPITNGAPVNPPVLRMVS